MNNNLQERVADTKQDLGYLIARVEDIGERVGDISDRLKHVEEQVSFYRWGINFVKALFWTGAFILMFKFGDILELWRK